MKIFKNSIFTFVLGLIIAGTIGVIAANVSADDISYGNGTVKDALDSLYDIEATQVATLTTQGATYTMQNDGYITETTRRSQDGTSGRIYFDGFDVSNIAFIAPWDMDDTFNVKLYAAKGTTVYTRSDAGTYNLTVYEWK